MVTFQGEALLLRSVDYGESDRIVHLLTAKSGRVTAMAKGARRSRRRFPGTLDVFNHLAITGRINPRASMALLEQAKLVNPFIGLRADPARYALASFLVEMIDRLSPEGITGDDADRLFDFAIESLGLVECVRPTATLRLLLELRGFDALGLCPEFGRCVRCGRVPSESTAADHRVHFHVPDGGIVCTACALRLEGLVPVDLGTTRILEAGLACSTAALSEIELGPSALSQAAALVFRFQRFHVGLELRSERFLEETLPIGTLGAA